MSENLDPPATDIAIIGMALRVPGANTVAQFWRNLRDGVESIRDLTDEELLAAGASPDELADKNYVRRTADLGGMEQFDADFFGFSRQEAAIMDPQHRHFLECAWEAIETSSRPIKSIKGPVGLFAGCGMGSYFYFNICSHPKLVDQVGMFLLRHTGNDKDFLATRASHLFDMRGPSVNVQTACSTSLVAVHYACQSLLNGECDMALAGGVTIELPHRRGYTYQDGEILSPDGHCRAFDHRASGTVFGSGTGVVVLRRLADAIADGDPIRAVIKATAINNDGASKAGYLAPSVTGQAEAIVEAHTLAGITADSVQYVECHGTGTSIGDPIEIEALTEAFRHSTDKKGFCRVGSVKSNIGHLDTAAGVISLIKAALALEHGEIPPTLGYEKPNPAINFAASPFQVCDRLTPWPQTSGPRRAGVNSLGVGGTNAHAVLEQAPARALVGARDDTDGAGPHLLVLSAKSKKALDESGRQLADFLEANSGASLRDIAATLFHGRTHFAHRRAVAANDRAEAIAILRATDRAPAPAHTAVDKVSGAVFVFPGGGAQYPGMARSLYRQDAAFRRTVDEGLGYLPPEVAAEIRALWLDEATPDAARRFLNPALQLPAILITEVAIARLWLGWGVTPTALIGHSMGENAAACIAGVLSFKKAVELVHLRGRLFTEIPPGGMLSVPLSSEALLARLPTDLDVASVNAPELCVVSGTNEALDRFQAALAKDDIEAIRVPIDIAAHSRMLTPILERFEAFLKGVPLAAPKIPIVSNLTGTWLTDAQARDPAYWRSHLASTVKFAEGMSVLAQDPARIYLETGPGRALSSLVKAQGSISANQVINSLPHADDASDDRVHVLGAVGRAWLTGLAVPLERLWAGPATRRVLLPTYPFQHETYWIPLNEPAQNARASTFKHASVDDWFAAPAWVQSPLLSSSVRTYDAERTDGRRWIVYSDRSALAKRIVDRLPGDVVVVVDGPELKRDSERRWRIDHKSLTHHQELLEALRESGFQPTDVIYCCGLKGRSAAFGTRAKPGDLQDGLHASFFVPTYIVRALARMGDPVSFNILTRDLAQISNEAIDPLRATLLGPILVAPRETPHIKTRCIDVEHLWLGRTARQEEMALLEELNAPPVDRMVALRGQSRWVQTLHKLNLGAAEGEKPWLRDGGVYVIAGGLGGIGLEVAEHFARLKNVKLALLARSELPPEAEWDEILRLSPSESIGAQRMRRVRRIRQLGAHVEVVACDITNGDDVERALEKVRATFGAPTGVIHAAGVMDDEPIESKSTTSMQGVLLPKIAGAMHLDRCIREPLDFFIMFSSVASSLGLPGQVDYSAANAFMDAFATDRASRAPGRTLVINWNAWRDVGMAVRASNEQRHGRAPSMLVAHPALDGYSDDPVTGRTFVTDFAVERHWLLSEHKIKNGMALLSGTTFVELARAAFCAGRTPGPIEINDLTFLAPFQVSEGGSRRLVIHIVAQGGPSEITMRTAGDHARSLPHVVGDISEFNGPAPAPVDLGAIVARCPTHAEMQHGGTGDTRFVEFGPRWHNLRSAHYGRREALLELTLAPDFAADLEHYLLHPAMLDIATGSAQRLIPGFNQATDFYVPVAYGRLRLFDRMAGHVFSHVRLRPESGNGVAFFDVTLMDAAGRPFCEISRFEMKRVDASSALVGTTVEASAAPPGNSALEKVLRDAIGRTEGLEAFDRVMAQPKLVRCVVSSMDVAAWSSSLDRDAAGGSADKTGEEGAGGFSRPDLDTAYEAPENDSERFLAGVWSELLGVQQIGVNDDFFQLGGHSLHAVRLFVAVRKKFGISLPLSTLLEKPNIRALAAMLDMQAQPASNAATQQGSDARAVAPASRTDYSSLVPIQPIGDGPAFYCAAGMGGNPLNLRALALHMGIDQPFYGLQPQGLDGLSKVHRTIPEMATHYIAEIRRKQPSGPYFLGGYSGGGVVAFEMAKQLSAAGEEIGALVFIDSIAPGLEAPSMTTKIGTRLKDLRQRGVGELFKIVTDAASRRVEKVATVIRKPLRRLFPYYYRMENITDTWTEAFAAYRPAPYSGDAMLFRASDDQLGFGFDTGPKKGWERYVLGDIGVTDCPGEHFSMCEEPHVRVMARRMKSYLRRRVRDTTVHNDDGGVTGSQPDQRKLMEPAERGSPL